ncbi:slr1702 [Synechocystis sp. PCC 6803]|uniref:Slr1702 protein n=1 Tax=Synechocystis sp. (strain ATCC 27184 / PCC 6803 / Kazusa) TaxID=1111708 RepID=P73200_SYNY3|nr:MULTISPECIES: DUF1995 family protein [unclassified Synechocystis]BAM50946.1 hypothetical protein BEST7613_2015 [Synechocystis sp. PCC 6803] [Bacillus subtilis BEST7613]AGF50916.1 hypothetical protein MYO_16580 [Synechocystis sp. PCC 6803]ALJ66963.1 hypothetical protein AOY38_03350 [Synechocystis sp. PCC 6803]AVP88806.1 DUF1995 domain-containing protein [Synechocystis sp. IPPAS B-1465]MBD2617318.1 DUF1995 family protein [Synechocystis sp. FACHB-898]
MSLPVPSTIDEAISEAIAATQRALDDGYRRIQVELAVPEIALQAQAIALEFSQLFADQGLGLRIIFPDTGAAALAKRDWGEVPFQIGDLGSRYTPIGRKIAESDQVFLVVSPSAVEVQSVEKLCELAGDRPVVLLIPQLEDVSIVGIGYAARQLRQRFLSTLFSAYYFRPLDGAVVLRSHPSRWQVLLEKGEEYELLTELPEKPAGEALERLLIEGTNANPQAASSEGASSSPKRGGIMANLNRFLKALSQ